MDFARQRVNGAFRKKTLRASVLILTPKTDYEHKLLLKLSLTRWGELRQLADCNVMCSYPLVNIVYDSCTECSLCEITNTHAFVHQEPLVKPFERKNPFQGWWLVCILIDYECVLSMSKHNYLRWKNSNLFRWLLTDIRSLGVFINLLTLLIAFGEAMPHESIIYRCLMQCDFIFNGY